MATLGRVEIVDLTLSYFIADNIHETYTNYLQDVTLAEGELNFECLEQRVRCLHKPAMRRNKCRIRQWLRYHRLESMCGFVQNEFVVKVRVRLGLVKRY